MSDDTRARRAAAGPDVVARLRDASVTAAARGRDELDAEVYHACMDAAAAIEARDAEIARLRALVVRAQLCVPGFYHEWHKAARAALAPPPASDGGEVEKPPPCPKPGLGCGRYELITDPPAVPRMWACAHHYCALAIRPLGGTP